MNAETETTYRYDPECMWVVVQTDEAYVHACDHRDAALALVQGGGETDEVDEDDDEADEADCDCYEPEAILRSPLEQAAPVLLDLCRRIPPDVLSPELAEALRRAVEYAGRTEHVEDIVTATQEWWDARPGK